MFCVIVYDVRPKGSGREKLRVQDCTDIFKDSLHGVKLFAAKWASWDQS